MFQHNVFTQLLHFAHPCPKPQLIMSHYFKFLTTGNKVLSGGKKKTFAN